MYCLDESCQLLIATTVFSLIAHQIYFIHTQFSQILDVIAVGRLGCMLFNPTKPLFSPNPLSKAKLEN
jgi:hypothetical protein